MLEGQIISLANKFLSTYLCDLNPSDLKLSLLNGEVELHNIVYRSDTLSFAESEHVVSE